MPAFSVSACRLQSGMNLQICFVNDSGSDKDSDADDSKTETSLDTPLSPMVWYFSRIQRMEDFKVKVNMKCDILDWQCESIKV